MIRFRDVSLQVVVNGARREVVRDCSFNFTDPRLLILSPEPHLRSGVVGLITGRFTPQRGEVRRAGRVSWAIGPTLPFRSNLTGRQTIGFVSDLYGLRRRQVADMVADVVDLPLDMDAPMLKWPVPAVVRFTYALALVPDFDVYVLDGPLRLAYPEFDRRWRAVFDERVRHRMLILSTAQIVHAPKAAGAGALLEDGRLRRVTEVRKYLRGVDYIAAPAEADPTQAPAEDPDQDMM